MSVTQKACTKDDGGMKEITAKSNLHQITYHDVLFNFMACFVTSTMNNECGNGTVTEAVKSDLFFGFIPSMPGNTATVAIVSVVCQANDHGFGGLGGFNALGDFCSIANVATHGRSALGVGEIFFSEIMKEASEIAGRLNFKARHLVQLHCATASSMLLYEGLKSASPNMKCPVCREAGVYGNAVLRMTELDFLIKRKFKEQWKERLAEPELQSMPFTGIIHGLLHTCREYGSRAI
nr:probable E3 ubiquitin-protein ligase BAH1-like [Tanacetum cinerariifolium]